VSAEIELAVVVLAGLAASAGAWAYARRRRAARAAERIAALAEVARRVDAAVAAVETVSVVPAARAWTIHAVEDGPAPEPAGRVALVDAVEAAVARAQTDGTRLAIGLVDTDGELTASLAERIRDVGGAPIYSVGTRSVALVLPGFGRAGALGVLARIQATCAVSGRAVELAPGEEATELIARLLAPATDEA
jgi:hypothetical protein